VTGVAGRHVLLGVSGGIACYKACQVARRLTEDGALVDVVLTASAGEFIRPVTFEALTGRPVVTSLWDAGRSLDHVRLGRECDLIIVAPATSASVMRARPKSRIFGPASVTTMFEGLRSRWMTRLAWAN